MGALQLNDEEKQIYLNISDSMKRVLEKTLRSTRIYFLEAEIKPYIFQNFSRESVHRLLTSAEEIINITDDVERLKVFYNTYLDLLETEVLLRSRQKQRL